MNLNNYLSICPSCKNSLTANEQASGRCGVCDCEFSPKQRQYALGNPTLYTQPIALGNGSVKTVIEMADGRVSGKILQIFGVWAVTDFGIECLDQGYVISVDRLLENDWLDHMSQKTWVNINDFSNAYYAAKKLHNIP
ncbi:hypothetical protein ACRTDM_21865 [Shewanella algae]|uniref:hypothetical protein n=1 Tax=Shewanella algae TaxID=38313 RepID=UPI0011837656|nr:hypothetical protein [Shewanella algae]TVL06904.1 hypothetical protein AYI84_02580 [Shewanella algae]TVL49027.1 hypothetical protein AYI99_16685 [Shewanella algae]